MRKYIFACTIFLLLFLLPQHFPVFSDQTEVLKAKIDEYTQKINELGKAKDTLSNQIKILNSQVELTLLKINQTENSITTLEKEIANLTDKISVLDVSLNHLSSLYIHQVVSNYKLEKRYPPALQFFLIQDFNTFFSHYKYLATVQKSSQIHLINLETVRSDYDTQRLQKENKQKELSVLQKKLSEQQSNLTRQKKTKANLLEVTKNDETKYQKLLSDARAEMEAIEAVIAGRGVESEVKKVELGEKIANIISGKSCSSSGTHLHFMVKKNNAVQNPLDFLKNIEYTDYSSGDSFNPSGSWNWPISPRIDFHQGYGKTWSIRNTWVGRVYDFHTGIDISGATLDIFSVQKGTMYRGSYKIRSANCTLKYVRVAGDDNTETLYLHVNYF